MDNTRLYKQIFKSFKTVLQMLKDRGNLWKTTLSQDSTFDEWKGKFKGCIGNSKVAYNCKLVYIQPDGTKGCVYWPKDYKIGVEIVKYYISLVTKNEYKAFILVVTDSVTVQSRKDMDENIKHVYNAEYFYLDRLQINITHHKYVPKHIKLSEEEKNKIVKAYNTPIENFPCILESDPISRYYNFRIGDLIKIERYFDHYLGKLNYGKKPDICYALVV